MFIYDWSAESALQDYHGLLSLNKINKNDMNVTISDSDFHNHIHQSSSTGESPSALSVNLPKQNKKNGLDKYRIVLT